MTSAHAGACSKCLTDSSNLLHAVVAFNSRCDPAVVAHTPSHSRQLCSCPAADSGETRLPRRQARLNALSYAVKQSHRDGVSPAFCFSLKRCHTGPSGCRWSKRNLSSAVVCGLLGFCHISPGEIKLHFFVCYSIGYIAVISIINIFPPYILHVLVSFVSPPYFALICWNTVSFPPPSFQAVNWILLKSLSGLIYMKTSCAPQLIGQATKHVHTMFTGERCTAISLQAKQLQHIKQHVNLQQHTVCSRLVNSVFLLSCQFTPRVISDEKEHFQ